MATFFLFFILSSLSPVPSLARTSTGTEVTSIPPLLPGPLKRGFVWVLKKPFPNFHFSMKPRPHPTPKPPLKRGEIITIRPKNPPVKNVIKPKPIELVKHLGPTYFEIVQNGALFEVAFRTKDSRLSINPDRAIAIQFLTVAPLKVNPSFVSRENWPKGYSAMKLNIQPNGLKLPSKILGKAFYTYCGKGKKNCKQVVSNMAFMYTPPEIVAKK